MDTVFFWIAWGLISFWALKTFYFSFSKEKLERLRKAASGISLAVFILTLVPWVPPAMGGKTALSLALDGNILALSFVILLLTSTILFLTKEKSLLKLASLAVISSTFVLFILMYQLRPRTFVVTLFDFAPIVAAFLLLLCDMVVLLLWQQLQLQERKGKRR